MTTGERHDPNAKNHTSARPVLGLRCLEPDMIACITIGASTCQGPLVSYEVLGMAEDGFWQQAPTGRATVNIGTDEKPVLRTGRLIERMRK